MKNTLQTLLFYFLFSNLVTAQSWINKENFPSTARTAVGSFGIGSKGYFIGGETLPNVNLVDLWEYDTTTNTWSQKANYPGIGTQKGVAFTIDGVGYYGLGTAGGQLYSYNSQNNTWTQKTTCSIPSVSFWSTTYFIVGTKAYFLDQNKKFFFYDSITDSWTLLSDFPGTKRVTGVGFTINNKGYICTGLNATSAGNIFLNDLWEYNPLNDTWSEKTPLPSNGRYASFGFAFNNKGYVLGGESNSGIMLNEFWEYNPISDSWSTLPNYIGGAKNYLSGFVANNSLFVGFGSPGFGVSFNEYGFFNQSSSFCTSLSGSLINGLVGYWPFCGNSNDESGNGNHGTVFGATLTSDRFGNLNSAYSFNGFSNKINFGSSQSLINLSQFTYSVWINRNSNCGNDALIISNYGGNWAGNLLFGKVTGNGNAQIRIHKQNLTLESESFINDNQWINLIATKDESSLKLYKNGLLIEDTDITNFASVNNNSFPFVIGSSGWSNSNYFMGLIDDVGVWNRVLTSSEISALYSQNQCVTNVTVTDTLIINIGQLSFENPIIYANNITIFPNPASTQININFNNITDLSGGTIKIINSLGQQVATTPITATGTNSTMSLNTWGGSGLYFVQILNPQGQIVDIKKIILQ